MGAFCRHKMVKIIILNSPPNTGKDETAKFLKDNLGMYHTEFKRKLFELTKSIYCIPDNVWEELYTRENKEKPTDWCNGLSPRNALINVSENIIKPNFGSTYFGVAAAKDVFNNDINTVFSDGGFASELEPLIELFGEENILVIRIHMKGRDFSMDSRNYLPDGTVKHMLDVENVFGEFDSFKNNISNIVRNFLD